MFPFIHSNIQQLQSYLTVINYFSDATKKHEKIAAVALAIFGAITALFLICHPYKAKESEPEQSAIPPHVNPNSPVNLEESAGKQNDEVKRKRQEIASLPLSEDSKRENLVYQSEGEIKEKGGILLIKNCNPLDCNPLEDKHYHGIVALPEKGGYCLHLCPGGGNMCFERDQIDQLMTEAIEELVKQKITITAIASFIGRHPGDTIKNFEQWQADQRNLKV